MRVFSTLFLGLFAVSELCAAEKIESTELPESKVWQHFREETEQGKVSKLPDFSRAGYRRGEIGIPDVGGPIFNVQAYGAVADDQFGIGCSCIAVRFTSSSAPTSLRETLCTFSETAVSRSFTKSKTTFALSA